MFSEVEQIAIAGHNERRSSLDGGCVVLVIIPIPTHAGDLSCGVSGASGVAPTFAPRVPIRLPGVRSDRLPFAAPETGAPGSGQTAASAPTLDRHQRGQRLALPFNDELVVPQGHPIQHVADSLPDIDRRDHGQFPSTFLHKAAGNLAAASIQM